MKRLALVALLLMASAVGARADNDVYNDTQKHARGDDALHVDTAMCSSGRRKTVR